MVMHTRLYYFPLSLSLSRRECDYYNYDGDD